MQAWTSSAGNAAALSLFRASSLLSRVGSDAAYIDEPEEKAIPPLLESRYFEEKVEGLKRTIALINLGKDVSEYFPQVVKNVATPSLEVKKLVFMYLVHYAEKKPDEALLAINTLQKDLSNPDPIVRALALRALTGIRVRVAAPLAVLAIQKCSRDASAYVRRCAAHAVLKLHSLDPVQYGPPMEAVLDTLLGDSSPSVVSSAAAALRSVAPETLGAFAKHFSRLCQMLPDLEEWGQIVVLDALLRCARILFPLMPKADEVGPERVGNDPSFAGADADGLRKWLGEGTEGRVRDGTTAAGSSAGADGQSSSSEARRQSGRVGESSHEHRNSNEHTITSVDSLKTEPENSKPLDRRRSSAPSRPLESASLEGFRFEDRTESEGGTYTSVSNPLPAIVRPDPVHNVTASEVPFEGGVKSRDSAPPELRLLLHCSSPLLTSRNSGVVLSAAVLHWHLAPRELLTRVVKPLTFLLRSSPRESQYLALCAIATMAQERPELFGGEVRRLFVRVGDPLFVRKLKLEVLTTVAGEGSVDSILKELQVYVTDADPEFVASVARALGKLARRLPTIASRCVRGLLSLALSEHKETAASDGLSSSGVDDPSQSATGGTDGKKQNSVTSQTERSEEGGAAGRIPSTSGAGGSVGRTETPATKAPKKDGDNSASSFGSGGPNSYRLKALGEPPKSDLVVYESVSVLCGLVRNRPEEFEFAAVEMVTGLERVGVSEARAAVLALLGDLCDRGGIWATVVPVVVGSMVGRFMGEEDVVKLAVLELASKYWLSLSSEQRPRERPLLHHAFTLAKYDSSVDIRDRARFLRHLLEVHGLAFPTGDTSKGSESLPSSSSMEQQKQRPTGGAESGSDRGDTKQGVSGRVSGVVKDERGETSEWLPDGELVRRLLLRPKPTPKPAEIVPDRASFLVGTMSHVANHTAPGYQPLPEIGASREAYGIRIEEESKAEPAADVEHVLEHRESESSEYSGSYESSDGESDNESEFESGAPEAGGLNASEFLDRPTTHASEESASGLRSGHFDESGRSTDARMGLQDWTANGPRKDADKEGLPTGSKEGGKAIAAEKHSKSTGPNFLGDLLSGDDLESWLGSLTVSGENNSGDA